MIRRASYKALEIREGNALSRRTQKTVGPVPIYADGIVRTLSQRKWDRPSPMGHPCRL